jgi:uncharacterized membrane protein
VTSGWPDAARTSWWEALWRRFWTLPVVLAVSSLLLGLVLPAVEAKAEETPVWVFQGGVDGARSVLSTIAGAMISVTGLVFSITIVVLQLASSQFSPRILSSFLESRTVQLTLGIFMGSFLYALTVLRSLRGGAYAGVPQLAVTVSYAYVVVAVAMFLAFIHHITTSVQVTQVMADIRRRTVHTAHRLAADSPMQSWSPPLDTGAVDLRNTDRSGYLTAIDGRRLRRAAQRHGAVVELEVTPGQHLVEGQHLGRVWGDRLADTVLDEVLAAITLSTERDVGADAAFGVRQLLDIAERALSPGVNDPTTAVQATNELHVVLRALAQLRDPSPCLLHEGEVVAVYRPQSYATMLRDTVGELAHHGSATPRVMHRLREILTDLLDVATPEHRAETELVRAGLPRPT